MSDQKEPNPQFVHHSLVPSKFPVPARHRRPIIAAAIWVALLLALTAWVGITALRPGVENPALWLLSGAIAVGLLLVVVGVSVVTRAGHHHHHHEDHGQHKHPNG